MLFKILINGLDGKIEVITRFVNNTELGVVANSLEEKENLEEKK